MSRGTWSGVLGAKLPQKLEAVAVISVGDWGDERRRREDIGAEGAEG